MHEQNVWYLICFEKIYHKLLLELLSINLCFWCDSFTVLLCIRVCLSLPDKLFISSTLHSSWQKRKEEWFFTNQRNYLFRFCDHDLPFIKQSISICNVDYRSRAWRKSYRISFFQNKIRKYIRCTPSLVICVSIAFSPSQIYRWSW